MVSKCIDQYTAQRTAAAGGAVDDDASEELDPRMEGIVERMFDRCYADGEYTQAMGIALEARRLDKVEETLQKATDRPTLLKYTFDVCQTLVTSRETRLKVLSILVTMHRLVPETDQVAVCKCLQFLGEVRPEITSINVAMAPFYNSKTCNVILINREAGRVILPFTRRNHSSILYTYHNSRHRLSIAIVRHFDP